MGAVRLAQISAEPLELAAHLSAVADDKCGALNIFVGQVRDHDPDAAGEVVALDYSAHPDAAKILVDLAARAAGDTGALVAVSHRVGHVGVGEAAVIIAVAAGHRGEAFEVCRAVIELIKTDLPVWKRQHEQDGTAQWKGLGG